MKGSLGLCNKKSRRLQSSRVPKFQTEFQGDIWLVKRVIQQYSGAGIAGVDVKEMDDEAIGGSRNRHATFL